MKPSREEVLKVAKECGYLMDSGRYSTDPLKIERFADAMYEAGAAAERAVSDKLLKERDAAIWLLAEWCVDVDLNGTGWDDWDENYKEARYRPGILRESLDKAIAEVEAMRKEQE